MWKVTEKDRSWKRWEGEMIGTLATLLLLHGGSITTAISGRKEYKPAARSILLWNHESHYHRFSLFLFLLLLPLPAPFFFSSSSSLPLLPSWSIYIFHDPYKESRGIPKNPPPHPFLKKLEYRRILTGPNEYRSVGWALERKNTPKKFKIIVSFFYQ